MEVLHDEMSVKQFDKIATTSITNWWNRQDNLITKFGQISPDEVYNTWKCKAIENFKGLFGVPHNTGLYFEVTFHAKKNRCYVDIYKKHEQIIIEI